MDVVGARAAGLQALLVDRGWLYDGVDCQRHDTALRQERGGPAWERTMTFFKANLRG